MTTIATLARIIAQRGRTSKTFFEKQDGFYPLIDAGLVEVTGKVQSILCDACSDPHDAEVIFRDGTYGFYCGEVGFCSVDESDVIAIDPNIGGLVAHLASVFACKRRKSTPIHADTWRIGAIDTPGGDLALYFHPTLQSELDVRAVESALNEETRSAFRLIISAVGKLPIAGAKSAELVDVVELDSRTNELTALTDPRIIAGAPQAVINGRPNLYAEMLQPLILSRIEENLAHSGLNKEAKAIREVLFQSSRGGQVPSLSTIKSYLSKTRTGQ
ncbi:hypothetical protein SAMN04488515_2367 [Cognatiyoonia koreensis]|uniref:Uncharacterized protein n=1 Tax=Cognatiyoonia koreensis TaxID=364200 RepID=A0A1I0QYI5_9RHOB|nr:hypothetical protein [Cognatiyoonia koreensis]SEW32936.1 hypothetical protein SAMN04488515_2367 [Cognatiyoonia koreensis]